MTDQNIFSTFIPEGSKTGTLIRSFDWTKSPLGPVGTWPPHLKTSVRNMLACRFPMYIAWENEFIQLYNDTYAPMHGLHRDHCAIGMPIKESWSDIWEIVEPHFNGVMETGKTCGLLATVFETTSKVKGEIVAKELRTRELQAQKEAELARQELNDFIMQAPYPMVVLLGPAHRFSIANPAYEVMVRTVVTFRTKNCVI